MKKLFALLIVFLISASLFRVQAFSGTPNSGEYTADTTVTINLIAQPKGTENAVSIDLVASGLTIINYTPPFGSTWIGSIGSCGPNQSYTTVNVCTSLAKTSDIIAGESLGTLTVQVKGSTYGSLTKTTDNAYSDGATIRSDSGVLAEFNKNSQGATQTTNPQSINLNVDVTSQPLILFAAVIVIVMLVLLMLWPRIKRVIIKPKDTSTSTPFV